jgi:cbb3-type cytochrome oxidase subunit 3
MKGAGDTIWMILIGVVMLAVLYMIVRPGSPAAKAIADVADALTALVATSTNNLRGKYKWVKELPQQSLLL